MRELRAQAQELTQQLERLGAVVPPVQEEDSELRVDGRKPKFLWSVHEPGKGNTKSAKRRRHRENQALLGRLVCHLEATLAAVTGGQARGVQMQSGASGKDIGEVSGSGSGSGSSSGSAGGSSSRSDGGSGSDGAWLSDEAALLA